MGPFVVSPVLSNKRINPQPRAAAIEEALAHGPRNLPVELSREEALRVASPGVAVGRRAHSVWGIRLVSDGGDAMARSGWVYGQVLAGSPEGRLPGIELCLVQGGRLAPLGQFSLMRSECLLVAFGSRAKAWIDAVAQAASGFDPARFDGDGYPAHLSAKCA